MKPLKALISKSTIHRAHTGSKQLYVVLPYPGDEYPYSPGEQNVPQATSTDGYHWWILTKNQVKRMLPFKHKNTAMRRSPYEDMNKTIKYIEQYCSKQTILDKFPIPFESEFE